MPRPGRAQVSVNKEKFSNDVSRHDRNVHPMGSDCTKMKPQSRIEHRLRRTASGVWIENETVHFGHQRRTAGTRRTDDLHRGHRHRDQSSGKHLERMSGNLCSQPMTTSERDVSRPRMLRSCHAGQRRENRGFPTADFIYTSSSHSHPGR